MPLLKCAAGYALDGYLTRANTLMVLETAKQKDGSTRARVTNIIDHIFHIDKEEMVQGETVLEVRELNDEPRRQTQTSTRPVDRASG